MRKILIMAVGIALIFTVPSAATGGSSEPAKAQHVRRFELHTHEPHIRPA